MGRINGGMVMYTFIVLQITKMYLPFMLEMFLYLLVSLTITKISRKQMKIDPNRVREGGGGRERGQRGEEEMRILRWT